MKRMLSLLLSLALLTAPLSACAPAEEPGPDPAPPEVQADPAPDPGQVENMDQLRELLWHFCRDEIEELNDAGGWVSAAVPNSTDGFEDFIQTTYGIPAGQWVDGFQVDDLIGSPFELLALRMADDAAAETYFDSLWEYRNSLKEQYSERVDGAVVVSEENAERYAYISGSRVLRIGNYLALFICRDAAGLEEVCADGLKALLRADPDLPVQPADDLLPVEIAEGVSVIAARWPEPEGEPDPDHPGRLAYTPSGNELMKLYDTAAIAAAWAAEDPSGLPDRDRAVYGRAEEVLADLLREGMSDFEKEVEIYDWVLRNVSYDWTHVDVLAEDDPDSYTPYGGLVNGAAVCLGFAATFQLLCQLAGVESRVVIGTALRNAEDHGWAMVRLNGEWYCADPTWDQPYYDGVPEETAREWRYFNVTSDYMARSHHQWDYDAVPEATATDYGAG